MKIIKASDLTEQQKEKVRVLWNHEYPKPIAISPGHFDDYLNKTTQHTHFLILDEEESLIGWACSFDREGDRWFSIIIDSHYQKKGFGRILINLLKEKENRLNGWVIDRPDYTKSNGEPYVSPVHFYLGNGFHLCPETRYEDEKLSAVKIEWIKSYIASSSQDYERDT